MIEEATSLPAYLQKMVDAGVTGIDVMHGWLKAEMLEAEAKYAECVKIEEENDYSDAMESMDRTYAEGYMDAVSMMYKYTYDISFAVSAKEAGE